MKTVNKGLLCSTQSEVRLAMSSAMDANNCLIAAIHSGDVNHAKQAVNCIELARNKLSLALSEVTDIIESEGV
jgi:hypothetical protein